MDGLTAVSLFAGIGGFDEALRRAGVSVVASVEIDEGCRSTLRRHFPETRLFNDVTEVTGDQIRAAGFVPSRGILCGGWPCQDLSVAGRRAGLGGARSGLFWQVVRLADDLRPRWLLLENVPGLLSAVCPCPGDDSCTQAGRAVRCGRWEKRDGTRVFTPNVHHTPKGGVCLGGCMGTHGGAMGAVVGALERLGYGLCWRVLDAQFFGVPQRRDRVFFAGCLGDGAAPVEVLLEPESGQGHPAARGSAWPGTAAAPRRSVVSALQGGGRRGHRIDAEGAAGGQLIAHAVTAREGKGPDSDATTGFVVASELIAFDAAQITSADNRVNPRPGDPQPPLAATGRPMVAFPVALRGRDDGSRVEVGSPGEPAFALRTPAGGSSHPLVATFGGEGVDHALTSEGADASEDGTGRGTPIISLAVAGDFSSGENVAQAVRAPHGQPGLIGTTTVVRRLSPLECERLQGFPDRWTLWDADGAEQSDSARYRQLGNAVAVPVVEWITRRIVAAEGRLNAVKGAA